MDELITATELRELEAGASHATSKNIRQALKDAADALEARASGSELTQWQQLGLDAAIVLENIGHTRVSHTMTENRAAELIREDRRKMLELADRFRELLRG